MYLILNPGSSSLKYKLYDQNLDVVAQSELKILPNLETKNHALGCKKILADLGEYLPKIDKIGVRVVHGGQFFDKPAIVNKSSLKKIIKLSHLAPLHNPPAVTVIKYFMKNLKGKTVVAVFDTTYYNHLPLQNKTYALPKSITDRFEIRRYGFHGISHKFTVDAVDPKHQYRVISIHLGGGCSITATNKGNVVDTSMGFTPLSGLIMQTRSGDIDPGIVFFLISKLGFKKAKNILENQSGLSGLTGSNGEMLEILYAAEWPVSVPGFTPKCQIKKEDAELALSMYVDSIRKYVGAYAAIMGGVDIIAFTGKVGEGSEILREKVMAGLGYLNYTEIEAVEPNEELAIVKEVIEIGKES